MCSSERVSFSSLGIADWLVSQVAAVGFQHPTPVQVNCIPPILSGKVLLLLYCCHVISMSTGRDCFGCAKTGSGKTAAFALPILQRLAEEPYGVFALVLTPTRYNVCDQYSHAHYPPLRELAYQIVDQFKVFGRHISLKAMVVTGGVGESPSSPCCSSSLTLPRHYCRHDEAESIAVPCSSCSGGHSW